jgi:cell division protein FtsL
MAVAAPQPRPSRRAQPVARKKSTAKRPVAQRRVANGVVWIVAVAIVLAGVVALNVAVLRANLRIDELSQKRTELRARNAMLESRLATAAATARIEQSAARDLGLRPADPARTFYVPMAP